MVRVHGPMQEWAPFLKYPRKILTNVSLRYVCEVSGTVAENWTIMLVIITGASTALGSPLRAPLMLLVTLLITEGAHRCRL